MEKPIKREIYSLPLNRAMRDLLLEITNLDNDFGCVASNQFLADSLRLKPDTISRYISKLKSYGFVKEEKFNGRTRTLRSAFSGQNSIPAVDKNPMQDRKIVEHKQGRGVNFSNADSEKKPSPCTLQITTNKVPLYTKEPDLEKIWNEFQGWAATHLTPATFEKVKKLKLKNSTDTISLTGESGSYLQEVIKKYMCVEKKIQKRIEFLDFEKPDTMVESPSLETRNKILLLSDYLQNTGILGLEAIAL